jgi:hypothetical protein
MELQTKNTHGGYRPGAGRKRGAVDKITINGLLNTLSAMTGDRPYEELLIEDFLSARNEGDKQLTLKYHNLIMSKVMNTANRVEIEPITNSLEAKQAAFAEALARLTATTVQAVD